MNASGLRNSSRGYFNLDCGNAGAGGMLFAPCGSVPACADDVIEKGRYSLLPWHKVWKWRFSDLTGWSVDVRSRVQSGLRGDPSTSEFDPNRSSKKRHPRQAVSPEGSCSVRRTRAAAMDVGGWLRRLGLEQYEAVFRDNEIDDTVLPSLTAEDLKELGVGFVGHRRKLLDAIAALRAEAGAPAPLSDAPPEIDKAAKDTAERRQVTVMFSDLVGSTALSARMDPEDLREIISAYQTCVADTVRRFGGFVARYMGDGVLIYFGYPAAHEDDAERAVRAGLELIDAVATLPAPEPLQVRIGVATGMVVVGDLVGSGEAQEHDIVGETPNLAARLQAIAEPNTVVIAEATRRLLGNLFELRDLGPKELKGIAGPVKAFAVLRASSVESRFEAMHPGVLTALVGREEELELLLRRWARAKTGEGQVVLLSGEAGIGKSRLAAALMEALAAEPHTRLRYFCSPQHTDSAFYPIIGQFERAAGFAHGDTSQTKLDKLDALLAQTATSRQDAALFAEMLSLRQRRTLPRFGACFRTAPAENAAGTRHTIGNPGALQPRADDRRGCALGRPHEPGSVRSHGGPDRNPSRSHDRDVSARVRGALGRTAARNSSCPQPAGPSGRRHPDRPRRRQQAAAGERQAGHHRAHRRHPIVRRRDDESGAGGRERAGSEADCGCSSPTGAGGPCELACLSDGAARPARPGQGGGTDRSGDRS